MSPIFTWFDGTSGKPEDIEALFGDWSQLIFYVDEEPAAGALYLGNEAHFLVAPAWRRRLITRSRAREFIVELLRLCGGMITTRILHGSSGPEEFVKRLGFEKTWSDEQFNYFALCKAPYERSKP